jgi:hypothetical protein
VHIQQLDGDPQCKLEKKKRLCESHSQFLPHQMICKNWLVGKLGGKTGWECGYTITSLSPTCVEDPHLAAPSICMFLYTFTVAQHTHHTTRHTPFAPHIKQTTHHTPFILLATHPSPYSPHTHYSPHATRHTPHITRHTPHTTRHTPHTTCHTPHTTHHTPTTHLPHTYHTPTTHLLHTYHTPITHLPHTYHTPTHTTHYTHHYYRNLEYYCSICII